jgi:hypothetical protein
MIYAYVYWMDCVPAYKCLGIWIDEKLSFKKHIDELVNKWPSFIGEVYHILLRVMISLHITAFCIRKYVGPLQSHRSMQVVSGIPQGS